MHAMNRSTSRRNRRMCGFATMLPSVFFFLALASRMASVAVGFSSSPSLSSTLARSFTELSATTKNYPPMSREEVQFMLDAVPVYAVTEPDQEGLVLLKEKNNPNDIAYFFFSPQAANTVFSPLRKKENESTGQEKGEWTVSAYPLGLVWFELINDPEQQSQGVEYRLLPEPNDLIGAQNLLREQQKQQSNGVPNPKINELFRSPYNDIPIFVDQFLRVTAPATEESEGEGGEKDNGERVPLYIGLKDLMDTCNKAIDASSGEYQAAMSAIDLKDLIVEMTKEGGNPNDYRRAILVPPTPNAENDAKPGSSSPTPDSDAFNWDGKQDIYGKALKNNDEIATPTATNDWSD